MGDRQDDHVLLLARYPVPGQAKTRLVPALGPESAARLHRRLAEHVAGVVRAASVSCDAGVTVCFTGAGRKEFRAWLGCDFAYAAQPPGDLGVRLRRALALALRGHARRVVAIATDVPDLSAAILQQALTGLREHDVVLGPAADGGYYLIGMKRDRPELFLGIDWGTGRVCAQTRDAIGRQGLSVMELPILSDVDLPEDTAALRADSRFTDVWTGKPLITVIIPTLDEGASLGRTLERVRGANDVEVVVADGGSRDATREIAAQAGAAVLVTLDGRGAQQNQAAAVASGRYLLFLHADTLLPDGYAELIRRTLDRPATVAGAFRFRMDGIGASMRLAEWGADIRSSLCQWPYGDQGLFMEKRVFAELGGFSPLPIMEDYELVSRLRRRGAVVTLREAAVTSARRWQELGPLRTTMRNLSMIAGFRVGIPPERLARFYRGIRNRD
jgi:rSAM/selenodomain-associated transferase 2/rSAM/selenodomain-associated transferase 1